MLRGSVPREVPAVPSDADPGLAARDRGCSAGDGGVVVGWASHNFASELILDLVRMMKLSFDNTSNDRMYCGCHVGLWRAGTGTASRREWRPSSAPRRTASTRRSTASATATITASSPARSECRRLRPHPFARPSQLLVLPTHPSTRILPPHWYNLNQSITIIRSPSNLTSHLDDGHLPTRARAHAHGTASSHEWFSPWSMTSLDDQMPRGKQHD